VTGKEMEIPTLVPTLTKQEINYLLTVPPDQMDSNPAMFSAIEAKAVRKQEHVIIIISLLLDFHDQ